MSYFPQVQPLCMYICTLPTEMLPTAMYIKAFIAVGELWPLFPYSVQCCFNMVDIRKMLTIYTLIARFMGPTWGPSGADRTQVGPMLALWNLLFGYPLVHLWGWGMMGCLLWVSSLAYVLTCSLHFCIQYNSLFGFVIMALYWFNIPLHLYLLNVSKGKYVHSI